MVQQPLTVHDWPASASHITLEQGLLVFALPTQPGMSRAKVRQLTRKALKEMLATLLACSVTEIELVSQPGQAIQLLQPELNIGLSISHDHGLSLIAINMNGKVGVDLMTLSSAPEINEMHTLATDYLGDKMAEYISQLPRELQQEAFTKAWTELEACLKCHEVAIAEWSLTQEIKLANCTNRFLKMPNGYIGTVAFKTNT